MSRTSNSIRNLKYAVIGQAIGLIISFISRLVFVKTLGAEYLGVSGLFTNILSMLSLAELGFGTAIIYSMYKPIAENDESKVKALMHLYKRAYISIGMLIFLLGTAITPFLNNFIKEMPDIPYIHLIYILFVGNTALSYFFSYKRSLITANQKKYIATFYRYFFYTLLNICQIITLVLTQNFILFLVLQIISTLLENIFVSRHANKLYPFLKEKNIERLSKVENDKIVKNVKAMLSHRIGGVVVNGTDNILISKYIGIISVGIYSNYFLIISALNIVFGLVFDAVSASVGNLGATEKKEHRRFIFDCLNFVGFWIFSLASVCLLILFNPFIEIWLGEQYLFSFAIVILLVVNFYLKGMRKSVLTFRDALGLFWYDRHKPIFEAAINLIFSIILVKHIGIAGVFLGTTISTLTTSFWVEAYVLFKYAFDSPVLPYFKKYISYTLLTLIVSILSLFISNLIPYDGIIGLFFKLVITLLIVNMSYLLLYWNTSEFQYIYKIVKQKIFKIH